MYKGKENAITASKLQEGEECIVIGFGQSMTPKIKSGQSARVIPIKNEVSLFKGDIVFCKVNGHYYLHLISAIKNNKTFQISNNHGHINGWVSKNKIYGKVIDIL